MSPHCCFKKGLGKYLQLIAWPYLLLRKWFTVKQIQYTIKILKMFLLNKELLHFTFICLSITMWSPSELTSSLWKIGDWNFCRGHYNGLFSRNVVLNPMEFKVGFRQPWNTRTYKITFNKSGNYLQCIINLFHFW